MPSFFVIAGAVLCTLHLYVFLKLRYLVSGIALQLALFTIFSGMLFMLIFRRRALDILPDFTPWLAYTWLGFIVITFLCFLGLDITRMLLWLFKLVSGINIPSLLSPRATTAVMLFASLLISAYAYYNAHNTQVKHFTLTSPKVTPDTDKLRIVALTDIHLGYTIGLKELQNFIRLTREQSPDIIVIVGDFIDSDMSARAEEADMLKALEAPGGKFAVFGNHEVYRGLSNSRSFITRSGFTLLENSRTLSAGINVVGINDPQLASFTGTPQPDAAALLKTADHGRFTLYLKHQPIVAENEIGLFDLLVSGHTHGGQIWPFGYITRKIFGYRQGFNQLEGPQGRSLLYLSNGTGYWGPPMRLGATPEITVFDILPEGN